MPTTIRVKKSGATGNVPVNTSLDYGELALNYADGVLYYKNSLDQIKQISGAGGNAFETVNANGSLLIADSNTDVLSINSGNGIDVVGNGITDTFTISVRLNDTVISTDTTQAATANSVKTAHTQANLAYTQANNAYGQANLAYTAANNRVLKAGDTMTGQLNISTGGLLVTGNVGIGTASPAYALQVNGSFAATTKSFVIDHPTLPGKKLRYGSLEGPENGVYVRGVTKINTIELPEYWKNLADANSITVNLTSIGKHQDLYVDRIEDNIVYIGNSNLLNKSIHCYYIVFAERKDVEKLKVEI